MAKTKRRVIPLAERDCIRAKVARGVHRGEIMHAHGVTYAQISVIVNYRSEPKTVEKPVKVPRAKYLALELAAVTKQQVETIRKVWYDRPSVRVGELADLVELEPETIWAIAADPSIIGQ